MELLLVEDHQDIAGIIFDFFEIKGYSLDYAANGLQGYELASRNRYDLIILDVMLPRMDGFTVCRKLRKEGIETPILMLTARDTREDTLLGFEEGADDYLIKPFDLEILEARIKALTRRRSGDTACKSLSVGDLTLDLSTREARRGGKSFALNPTSFSILKLLMMRTPNVVGKQELVSCIWDGEEADSNLLRTHIYQLRTQIDKPFSVPYLLNVPKLGYRLVAGEGL